MISFESILAQAKQLTPADQARLITALIPTANTQQVRWPDPEGRCGRGGCGGAAGDVGVFATCAG